jgi:carbonic anhydrase
LFFDCPLDQVFFRAVNVSRNEFLDVLRQAYASHVPGNADALADLRESLESEPEVSDECFMAYAEARDADNAGVSWLLDQRHTPSSVLDAINAAVDRLPPEALVDWVRDKSVSAIDEALKKAYAARLGPARKVAPKLSIVTCMDPRLNDLIGILGSSTNDADVIRNAGSSITEDTIRSLVVSTRVLGSREVMIINHTDCRMLTITDSSLEAELEEQTGAFPVSPARFYSFNDLEADMREQIKRAKGHPWISPDVPIRGFIYDVNTGQLSEVTP